MKIVTYIALCGVLCCIPLFVQGDENTNAPEPANSASASGPVTNQPARLPPPAWATADPSVPTTNQPAQAAPSPDDSIDSLRKKAEAGDASSQFLLGSRYQSGSGIQKDAVAATKWYRMAADQKYALAQYNLGLCYANGWGVPIDLVEAARWYRMAAE